MHADNSYILKMWEWPGDEAIFIMNNIKSFIVANDSNLTKSYDLESILQGSYFSDYMIHCQSFSPRWHKLHL